MHGEYKVKLIYLFEPGDISSSWSSIVRGSNSGRGKRFFFLQTIQIDSGAQPPVQWIQSFFSGIKWLESNVDHSSSSSGEDKNEWS
jgi:hypothetical protein